MGGLASAAALAIVALLMGLESAERLLSPQFIRFNEAILAAVIGLVKNPISAWLHQRLACPSSAVTQMPGTPGPPPGA